MGGLEPVSGSDFVGVSNSLGGLDRVSGLDPVGVLDPLVTLEPVIDISTSTKYFTIITPSFHHYSDLISVFSINFIMLLPITNDSHKSELHFSIDAKRFVSKLMEKICF